MQAAELARGGAAGGTGAPALAAVLPPPRLCAHSTAASLPQPRARSRGSLRRGRGCESSPLRRRGTRCCRPPPPRPPLPRPGCARSPCCRHPGGCAVEQRCRSLRGAVLRPALCAACQRGAPSPSGHPASLFGVEVRHDPGRQNRHHRLPLRLDLGCALRRRGSNSSVLSLAAGPAARERVFAERARSDAVIIGGHTVRRDNPKLTTRQEGGHVPLRIVMSGSLDLPEARGATPASLLAHALTHLVAQTAQLWDVSVAPTIVMVRSPRPCAMRRAADPAFMQTRRGVRPEFQARASGCTRGSVC